MKFKSMAFFIFACASINTIFAHDKPTQAQKEALLREREEAFLREREAFEREREALVRENYKEIFAMLVTKLEALHKNIDHTGCLTITEKNNMMIINGRPYRRNPFYGGIEDMIKLLFREEGVNRLTAQFDHAGKIIYVEVVEPTNPYRMLNSRQSSLWFWQNNKTPKDEKTEHIVAAGVSAIQYFSDQKNQDEVQIMEEFFSCVRGKNSRCSRVMPQPKKEEKEEAATPSTLAPQSQSPFFSSRFSASEHPSIEKAPEEVEPTTEEIFQKEKTSDQAVEEETPVANTSHNNEENFDESYTEESAEQTSDAEVVTAQPAEKFFGFDGGRKPWQRTPKENKEVAETRFKEITEEAQELINKFFNS